MIILSGPRIVVVTPPKTGSNSLHRTLCSRPGNVYGMGPQPWSVNEIEKHTLEAPRYVLAGARWVLAIRHPYTRVQSLYAHRILHNGIQDSLSDWLDGTLVAALRKPGIHWESPCAAWIDNPDGVIRMEHMEDDLQSIVPYPLPMYHDNKNSLTKPLLTEQDKATIRDLYASDFRLGGYHT